MSEKVNLHFNFCASTPASTCMCICVHIHRKKDTPAVHAWHIHCNYTTWLAICLTDTDRHSNVMNLTSRLAIRLRHFPDWVFDWQDMQPQRSRDTLTFSDFLPCEDERRNMGNPLHHALSYRGVWTAVTSQTIASRTKASSSSYKIWSGTHGGSL